MKKIPIFLLTLILGIVFSTSFSVKTQALSTDKESPNWYEISELLEYKTIVDAERQNICGSDLTCQKQFTPSIGDEEKYAALIQIESLPILLTSINPKQETIKLLIWDEDFFQRRIGGTQRYGVEIKRFFLGWFSSEEAKANFSSEFKKSSGAIFNNEVEGAHMIIGYRSEVDSPNLLSERDREVEYTISLNSDILNNTTGNFSYKIKTNYFNSSTDSSYANCLSDENYQEGTECRLKVSAKDFSYFAVQSSATTLINDDTNGVIDTSEAIDTNETTEETIEKLETLPVLSVTLPKAPDTGASTTPCKEKVIEFPWWLGVLIILGNLTCLWLFWPNNHEKSRKKS